MFTVVAKQNGQIKVIGSQDDYASAQFIAFHAVMYNRSIPKGFEIIIFKNGKYYKFFDIK